MAYVTSYSNFIGGIAIPNLVDTRADGQLVTTLIEQYEQEYLITLLGYDLAQSVISEIDNPNPTNAPYYEIVTGATFTDISGDKRKWSGFVVGRSPIANYIYTKFLELKEIQLTGLGSTKQQSENATIADGSMQVTRAWNDMVNWNYDLNDYLVSISSTYSDIEDNYIGIKYPPSYVQRRNAMPNQLLFFKQNPFSL
jgi:hypothetical protein